MFSVVSPQSGTAIPVVFTGLQWNHRAARLGAVLVQKRPNVRNPNGGLTRGVVVGGFR